MSAGGKAQAQKSSQPSGPAAQGLLPQAPACSAADTEEQGLTGLLRYKAKGEV